MDKQFNINTESDENYINMENINSNTNINKIDVYNITTNNHKKTNQE